MTPTNSKLKNRVNLISFLRKMRNSIGKNHSTITIYPIPTKKSRGGTEKDANGAKVQFVRYSEENVRV